MAASGGVRTGSDTTTTSVRSAQREATRSRLFTETVEEFKRRGFADTEISAITERVGVTRGAFYVHFAGKDAVLRELLLIEERRIAATALRDCDETESLETAFGAVVDAVLAAERRLGRRLVRDLCAAQFRPEVARDHDVGDHPVGLMLVETIASVILPLGMTMNDRIDGALQRLMFTLGYLWYAREAWPSRNETDPRPHRERTRR